MDTLLPNAECDAEILALADAHVHGTLSAETAARLEYLVVHDANARLLYVEYLQDSYHLHRLAVHALADEEEVVGGQWPEIQNLLPLAPSPQTPACIVLDKFSPLPSPLSSFPSFVGSWMFANLFALLVMGLGLLGAWFYQIDIPRSIAHNDRLSVSPGKSATDDATVPYVGRITGMVDCRGSGVRGKRSGESGRWSETDKFQIPNPKSLVSLGDSFALSSGLLEITYDTGAKVILQAPCAYKVESRDGGFLSVGKLTARLEKKVQEASSLKSPHPLSPAAFVVRTPMAVVTDLGTEFGVEVGPTGVVETCVFDGRVRVDAIGRNGVNAATQELSRGEAVRILPREYVIRPAVMKSEQFVRHLPRVGTIRDNFEVKRNYLTDGTSGTVWSGILNVDKALRLDTLPVNIDGQRQAGLLTIAVTKDSWAGWAQPHRDRTWNNAPYLFVNVAKGDFEARVHIQSQTAGPWSVAGLMVRREDGGFASVNCNRFDSNGCQFATRGNWTDVDTDNSVPAEADKGIALRLVRMGDTFMASGSIDDGQTWKALNWGEGKNSLGGTVMRLPDMVGAVQVGLWYGTFNPAEGEASFQNFIIERRK